MNCPKCERESSRNGKHSGKQRYKCKGCNYQFVSRNGRGKDKQTKCAAVTLYLYGLSFRAIAKYLKVSHTVVMNWVRAFAKANYEKPEITEPVIIELDEMWHFVGQKKLNVGFGKPFVEHLVSLSTGSAETGATIPSDACTNA